MDCCLDWPSDTPMVSRMDCLMVGRSVYWKAQRRGMRMGCCLVAQKAKMLATLRGYCLVRQSEVSMVSGMGCLKVPHWVKQRAQKKGVTMGCCLVWQSDTSMVSRMGCW